LNEKERESKKGEFIDLDKSQFKKKSNFIRNLVIFLFVGLIFFTIGFFTEIPILKNTLSYFKLDNNNKKSINSESVKSFSRDDFFNKIEVNEKVGDLNILIGDLERQIIENNKQIFLLEEKLEEIMNNAPQDFSQSSFSHVNSGQGNLKTLPIMSLYVLKKNLENRIPFENELEELIKIYTGKQDIIYLLDFFKTLDVSSLKERSFFLDELNNFLSIHTEDFEQFILRLENKSNLEEKGIFESKENFLNYLREVFYSTFKVTKIKDPEVTNNFSNLRYKELLRNTLINAKESLLYNDLKKSLNILEGSNFAEEGDIKYWIEEAKKVLEAEEKLGDLERKIIKQIGINFD